MTYTAGQWSTLFAAAPPAGAGVALPDGSRFVCQVAKITVDNVDNSPAPTWVDISAYVNRVDWLTGDTQGAISRWPIEQFAVTTADVTAVLGDFVDVTADATATGPTPGSFARWGILRVGGAWQPLMSGIVDSFTEIIGGRVRGWRIQVYGTLLYWSGCATAYTSIAGGASSTAGERIDSHIAYFVAGGAPVYNIFPWPFASTIAAQNVNYAPHLGVNLSAVSSNPRNCLTTITDLVDAQGARVLNGTNGGLISEPWESSVASTVRLSDEPTAGAIFAVPAWKRSQDRTAGSIDIFYSGSPAIQATVTVNAQILAKWGSRSDINGWPKTSIASPSFGSPVGWPANMMAAAATQFARELRLDQLNCDTARDPLVWGLLTGSAPIWTRSRPTFERRRPGVTALDAVVHVHAVAGTIEFSAGVGHALLTYFTRLV